MVPVGVQDSELRRSAECDGEERRKKRNRACQVIAKSTEEITEELRRSVAEMMSFLHSLDFDLLNQGP